MTKLVRICVVLMLTLGFAIGAAGIASAENTATVNGDIVSEQSQTQNGVDQTGTDNDGDTQVNTGQNANDQVNVNTNEATIVNGDVTTNDNGNVTTSNNDETTSDNTSASTDETTNTSSNEETTEGDEFIDDLVDRLVELLASLLDDGEEDASAPA